MSTQELIEKALTVGVSSLISAAGGYVIAAFTLKKSLNDGVAAAKLAIETKVTEEAAKLKVHLDAEIKKVDNKVEHEITELKSEDLKAVEKLALKVSHETKNSITVQLTHIQRDIDTLERKTEGVVKAEDFRRFNEEQTSRWEAVQRSLGLIEGQLLPKGTPGGRR
jgi:predicted Zn-dependent protease